MIVFILGVVLFLGVHSVRIVADGWRGAQVARLGIGPWKIAYSVVSALGLALIVWGYGMTRGQAALWQAPAWTQYPVSALMLVSFILLVAAYVPRNRIKAVLGHPMVVGVKVWAFAHLLVNGRFADIVLFGAFLAWAVLDFRALRSRDRAAGKTYPAGTLVGDIITLAIGVAAWAAFARVLHLWLIGVPTVV
jgi:uncharacterized membrane protein